VGLLATGVFETGVDDREEGENWNAGSGRLLGQPKQFIWGSTTNPGHRSNGLNNLTPLCHENRQDKVVYCKCVFPH
jgi:hypothetical protein